MVTDIVFSSEEINLGIDDTDTIVADVLPEDADNKTLSWSSDSPSIVSVTVDEDTHSATVKGVSEGEAIITAAATDGSGVSAMCNVSVVATPPPPTADYYVKSAQYYTVDRVGTNSTLAFRNTDDTEYLVFNIENNDTVNIGKYNGMSEAINIYATMDLTQKTEYLIRSIEDNGYIEIKKPSSGSPEIWIYNDHGAVEKIIYNKKQYTYPITLNYRYTYIPEVDNLYKYISFTFSNNNYYVNYGSQRGSSTVNYTASAVPTSTLTNVTVTLQDPAGRVSIKKQDINGKSLELTSVKDGITTKDLYAAYGSVDIYCKIQTKDDGYICYGHYGSSIEPVTYPYDTISKTHTWSPT